MDKKRSSNTSQGRSLNTIPIPNYLDRTFISRSFFHNAPTTSSFVQCPYCSYEALTNVRKSLSIVAVLACISTLFVVWALVQKLRGKSLTFFDIQHYCLKCDNMLAEVSAC